MLRYGFDYHGDILMGGHFDRGHSDRVHLDLVLYSSGIVYNVTAVP